MAGIYLHIPFCKQACTYCNFHFSTLLKTKEEVLKAIQAEISLRRDFFPERTQIDSIYFGGGTPSLLKPEEVMVLIDEIARYYSISPAAEITLEANPDDLTPTYLSALKKGTPVNRFSIGVQSFFDEDLQYMHRAHRADEAKASIQRAQDAGFEHLSADLIYGTPGLSDDRWQQNLQILFDLGVPHISCYALTVEDKTLLADQVRKQKESAPDEEQTARQFSKLLEAMKGNSYTHYEISNFCREPHFAIHNTNYWKGIPYLGIGPSAHSFDGEKRYWNIANNALYAKKILSGETAFEFEVLSDTERYNEFVMTGIRTMWGIDRQALRSRFGKVAEQHFLREISPFVSNQWVDEKEGIYILTDSGKLFCDFITEHVFMNDEF